MTTIYFMLSSDGQEETKVAGETLRDEYRQKGWTVNGSVADDEFLPYSTLKRGVWWEMVKGTFVKLKQESEIPIYYGLLEQRAELNGQIAASNQKQLQYLDGVITEEDYAPVKAARQVLWNQLNAVQASIDEYEVTKA